MADNDVRVELSKDNAVLLLAAAEELELDPGVVRTTSDNVFIVPSDVAKKAGVKEADDGDDRQAEIAKAVEAVEQSQSEAPAKKAAAKKAAPAKKAAAKKATSGRR
jgi:2-keto-3-deoxy-L-rhamnonate aldolase RhmA